MSKGSTNIEKILYNANQYGAIHQDSKGGLNKIYDDNTEEGLRDNRLANLFILLKTLDRKSFKEDFLSNGTYRKWIRDILDYVSPLKGDYKTSTINFSASKLTDSIRKYLDDITPSATDIDVQEIKNAYPEFVKIFNENPEKINKFYQDHFTGLNKAKGSKKERTSKGVLADFILNGFDENGNPRSLNNHLIDNDEDGNAGSSDNSGQEEVIAPVPKQKEQEKQQRQLEIPKPTINGELANANLYDVLSHFTFNYSELLDTLRRNPQYNFKKEFEYFDQAKKQIKDLENVLDAKARKFPLRESNYDKVKAFLPLAEKKIEKIEIEAMKLVQELTRMRYVADSTAIKYHKKIMTKLYEASSVISEVYQKTAKAGLPTKTEIKNAKSAANEEAWNRFLTNTIVGRHLVQVAMDKLKEYSYNKQVKDARKYVTKHVSKEYADKLIREYTEAFKTRDKWGRPTREAAQKMLEIENEIQKASNTDDKLFFQKIFKFLNPFKNKEDYKDPETIEIDDNPKEEKDNKTKEAAEKTLNNVEKPAEKPAEKTEPEVKETPKINSAETRHGEIKKNYSRGAELVQEILRVFNDNEVRNYELNRRKLLRLLKELKETDTELFTKTMERLNASPKSPGSFKVPKSETGKIESNLERSLRQGRERIFGSSNTKSIGSKIKDWIQNKIDNQYQRRKMNEEEELDESAILTTIGLGAMTAILGVTAGAVMAAGASWILSTYAGSMIKIFKFTRNCWTRLGKEFTEEDLKNKVKKLTDSKDAQRAMEKIEKTEDKYFDELHDVYMSIEEKNWNEASESFKDLSTSLQNNPDIIKAVINKISEVVGEPPLYINSPGNETYQAIKKIINIKVAKSAAEAVRKAIE